MAPIARSCRLLVFAAACALAAVLALGAAPASVRDMLSTAVEQLANADATAFLSHFDRKTPGYLTIARQVNALMANDGVSSTIEVLRDEGDDQERKLEIDWVLRAGPSRQKHTTVKMTVTLEGAARQRKEWKITSFAPEDLFAAP